MWEDDSVVAGYLGTSDGWRQSTPTEVRWQRTGSPMHEAQELQFGVLPWV